MIHRHEIHQTSKISISQGTSIKRIYVLFKVLLGDLGFNIWSLELEDSKHLQNFENDSK